MEAVLQHPREHSTSPGVPLQPIVLRFRLSLTSLAPLESLHFVLGDYDDERFWSLVQYCRQSPQTWHALTYTRPALTDGMMS